MKCPTCGSTDVVPMLVSLACNNCDPTEDTNPCVQQPKGLLHTRAEIEAALRAGHTIIAQGQYANTSYYRLAPDYSCEVYRPASSACWLRHISSVATIAESLEDWLSMGPERTVTVCTPEESADVAS